MKIGLNLLYLKPGVVGGTETYATGLINELKKRIDNGYLWVFINKETKEARLFVDKNIKIIKCPIPARMSFVRYFYEQVVLPFQIKIIGIDLIHSLGYVQPLCVPCKSVVTIHDLNYISIGESMSPLRRNILKHFIAQSAKRSDHILTDSNFSKNQIVKTLNVPSNKITVAYISIKKRPDLPLELQSVTEIYGIRKPYLFALGSLSPHKNIKKLIEAFLLLKKRGRFKGQLVISGHIPRMKNDMASLIREMGLENDIVTTGYISDMHITALYKNADIFVFPSLYEGFGIPVLEAFYYGVPVACSNVAAVPEIAGDAAVYFNPKDSYDIANAIDYLFNNKEKRLDIISKGRERLNLFKWENAADITIKVYRNILNKMEV